MFQSLFKLLILFHVYDNINSSHWLAATQGNCKFTLNTERMIFFNDNPSLFVNSFKKKDLAECRLACCSHDTCNGYVWDTLESDNCRLLRCSKKGDDCKAALKPSNTVTIGEVGFITGLNDGTGATNEERDVLTTQKPNTITTLDPLSALAKHIFQTSSKQHPTAAKTLLLANNKTQKLYMGKQVSRKDHANTTNKISSIKESTTENPTLKSSPQTMDNVVNTSTDTHEHTNNISLTIALIFGLCFSATILYMLGRRWVEGIKENHKRGYTRVSYLLNGV